MIHPIADDSPYAATHITYRFGRFLLDGSRRLLLSGTETVPLPEKIFRILLLLLEADGRTVTKEKFSTEVWPDDPVSDANLTQHVFMLRQMLGERARQNTYVLSVAGKGYRLAVPVESKFGLTMKGSCERCRVALAAESNAYICSYECTFCAKCVAAMSGRCPNCSGELTRRPSRGAASVSGGGTELAAQ